MRSTALVLVAYAVLLHLPEVSSAATFGRGEGALVGLQDTTSETRKDFSNNIAEELIALKNKQGEMKKELQAQNSYFLAEIAELKKGLRLGSEVPKVPDDISPTPATGWSVTKTPALQQLLAQIKIAGETGSTATQKYLIYSTNGGRLHGGFGSRLWGVANVYLWSLLTGRRFVMEYNMPHPFSACFEPADVHWDARAPDHHRKIVNLWWTGRCPKSCWQVEILRHSGNNTKWWKCVELACRAILCCATTHTTIWMPSALQMKLARRLSCA
jgi:hypothetical protein